MKKKFLGLGLVSVLLSIALAVPAAAVCERPIPHKLLFSTSIKKNVPSQVLLADNLRELKKILEHLGLGPFPNDLDRFRFRSTMKKFLVTIGAPRKNGCRFTKFLCVQQGERFGQVEVAIAEIVPGCACICTDEFKGSAVFITVVPSYVKAADLVSLRRRHDCGDCDNSCPIDMPTGGVVKGELTIDQTCP